MNKFNWIYVDDTGKKNTIGIMHSVKSGHLLIYCNTKIIRVDFQVFQNKTYSFFIEEELIEIVVERKGNQFAYGFDINKEVDTPRNQFRKQQERKNLKMIGLFFIGFFLFIGVIAMYVAKNRQENKALAKSMILSPENSDTTFAKVFIDSTQYKKNYSFVANNQVYNIPISNLLWQEAQQELFFPIESNDEFTIVFSPKNPYNHQIKWNHPSSQQIELYKKRAIQQEITHNKNRAIQKARCYVDYAYQAKGLKGVALFYHQDRSENIHKTFNSNAYKRLIRSIPFKKAVEQRCWE